MRPPLPPRRPRRLALSLSLLTVIGAAMAARPPDARAQGEPFAYALRETWASRDLPLRYERLDWPAGHLPGGIGHDPVLGHVYVTDRTDQTIRVYDAAHRFTGTLAGPGDAPGRLDDPRDLAVLAEGERDLVVSDSGNGRLQVLARDGSPRALVPIGDPQGIVPALADNPEGSAYYVIDRAGKALRGFDAAGAATLTAALNSPWIVPENLAVTDLSPGRNQPPPARTYQVMLADPGMWQLRGLQLRGGQMQSLTTPILDMAGVRAVATGTAIRPDGSRASFTLAGATGTGIVWADAPGDQRTAVPFADVTDIEITSGGEVLAAVMPEGLVSLGEAQTLIDGMTWPLGRLVEPDRIAVGDAVLLADAAPRVQIWDRAGTPLRRVLTTGAEAPTDVASAGERAYVLGDDGTGMGWRVYRIAGEVLDASWAPPADGPHRLVAIAARGDRLAVLDLTAQTVWMLDANLNEQARWPLAAAGDFAGVLDIALGQDRVFLADAQSSEVGIWSLAGARLGTIRVPTGPLRIAAGPGDTVFVLTASKWVFVYDAAGQPRGAWPAGAPEDRPADLALDASGLLYVADVGGTVRVYGPDAGLPGQLPPASGAGRCAALRDKGASPREIMLGETVEVSLVVEGECPFAHEPAEVVLAIDRSGSMREGGKMAAARDAAVAFLAQTDPRYTRVALVSFDSAPTLERPLTSDRQSLIERVSLLAPLGGTDLVRPLDMGVDLLTGGDVRPGAAKVIVFMSDGRHTGQGATPIVDPPGMREAIDRARAAGLRVFTIGLGGDVDESNLRRMAAVGGEYFHSPTSAELRDIYVQIARRIAAAELFRRAVVTDRVPGNMRYSPGSGRPLEPQVSTDGKTLTWDLGRVLEPGFRLSYRLQPEQVGLWPTNVFAHTDAVDGFGNVDRLVFPVPQVRVRAGDQRAYLPIAIRERCEAHRLNVALLIDTSSSMRTPFAEGGRPKIEAAQAAALAFLRGIDLRRDQVTIARFDAAASILAWGGDAGRLEAAVRGLGTHEGTRIDLGLAAVRQHLAGPGFLPGGRPVVVLMSDGAPGGGSEIATRLEAQRLSAAGVTLFAVGVGADADRAFLAELAGPRNSYHAADADVLVQLYGAMATGLAPCVPSWER